jgi:hypothetical protein
MQGGEVKNLGGAIDGTPVRGPDPSPAAQDDQFLLLEDYS